jgi:hypothetical protein
MKQDRPLAAGPRGATGKRGPSGATGPRGSIGKPGPRGVKGLTGTLHKAEVLDQLVLRFEDVYKQLTAFKKEITAHQQQLDALASASTRQH